MNIDADTVAGLQKYWSRGFSVHKPLIARSAGRLWKDAYLPPPWLRKKYIIQGKHAAAGKSVARNRPAPVGIVASGTKGDINVR
jgi:hypothetical protein